MAGSLAAQCAISPGYFEQVYLGATVIARAFISPHYFTCRQTSPVCPAVWLGAGSMSSSHVIGHGVNAAAAAGGERHRRERL